MSSFFRKKVDDKSKHAKKAAHNSDDDFDEILDVEEVLNEEKKIDLPDSEYRRREWPGGYCFQVEVVETHRKFPGGDFGPRRLPTDRPLMATIDGKVERKLNDVTKELPLKYCEWVTPWEIYQGTDPRDHYVNSGGGALMASITGNKEESKMELLSRFDLSGWEYAPDFPRDFHPKPAKMKDWVRRRFWRRVFVAKVSIDVHIPFPEDFRIIMQSSLVKKNEYLDHIKMLSQNRRASITMETEQSEQRQDQERKRLEMQKKLEAEVRKQEEKEASRKQNKDKFMNALGHVGSGLFQSKSSEFSPEVVEEEASTFLDCPGSGYRVVDGDEGCDEGEGYGIPSPAVAPNAEDPDRYAQLFRIENAKRRQLASDRRVFLEEVASTFISERFHVAAAVARAAEEQQRLEQEAKEQELLDAKDPAKAAALRSSTRIDAATPMGSEANFASSASTVWGSDDEDVTDPDKRDDEYRDRDWPVGFSFMVELMESQRYFPVGGWSHKRLISDPVKYPFTTEDGKIKRSLNKVTKELPSTHAEWVTPWEVYFGTDLSDLYKGDSELSRFDEDGWEYAPSFRFGSYKNRQSMGTWVRRRFWRRVFVATVGLKVQIPFPENFKVIMGKALVKESEYNESVKMLRRNRIATRTKQQEDQKNLSTSGKSLQKSGSLGIFGGKSSESIDNMSPRAEDTAALSLLHALDEEGTTYDDTVNWSTTSTLLVEVVETQRKWPLSGWTDGRLRTDRPAFATQDGLISRPLAVVDSELPSPNCTWVSPWQIYIGSGNDRGRFDEDGWEYAIDFPQKHVRHASFVHVVRRRFWRRVFAVVIDDGKFEYPPALNKVMTQFKISKNAYAVSVQHPTNVQLARKNAPGGGLLGLIGGGLRRTDSQSSMGASSFASTVFDPTDCDRYIDVAWTKTRTFKVRVVETQRRFPFSGWSDRRLPTDRWAFANEEGTLERKLSDVTQDLPRETCQWITPWQIVVDPNPEDVAALIQEDPSSSDVQELQQRVSTLYFDEDGWEYAVDFPREFNRVFHNVTHWVRRRFWERVFHISDATIDINAKVLAGERKSIRVEHDADHKPEEVTAKKSAACRMSLTNRFAGVSLSSVHALASTNAPGSMNTTVTDGDVTVTNLDDTVVLIPDGVEFPDEFENVIRRLDESKMVFYTNHKKLEGEDLARKNDGGGGFGKFLGGFLATKETLKQGANGFKNALGALAEVSGSPTSPFSPGAIPMGSLHGEELSLEEHTGRKEIFTEVSNYLQKVEDTFLDGLAEATARQARREIREKERRRRQVLDKNSYSPDGRKGSLIVTIREGRKLYKAPSEVGTPIEVYLTCEYRDKTVGESPNFTTDDRSPRFDTPFPLWVSDDRSTVEINVFVRSGITGSGELKWRTGINLSRPLTNVVRTVDEETLTFVEEGLVELPLLNYVPSGGILHSAETLFPFLAAATTWSEAKSEDVSDAAATSGFKGDRPSLIVGWKFEIREDDPAANVGFCPVCARLQGNCLCTGATKAAMLKSQKLNKARRRRDEFIAQKAREKRESDSHEKRDVVDLRIARLTTERECYQKLLDTFRVARSELSKTMINMQDNILVVRLFNLLKSYAFAQDFRRAVGARVLSHPAMLPCQHQGWLKADAIRLKRAFLTWLFFQNRRKAMVEIEKMRGLKLMLTDVQTSGARTIEAEVDAGQRLLFDREEEYISGRRSVRDEMAKALNLSPQQLLEMKWATSAKESSPETKTMKSNSCCTLQ